jgi:uncharacterized protein (DUF433 family)
VIDGWGNIGEEFLWTVRRSLREYNEGVMEGRAVVSDPEIMNGTPCFQGTRVPFKNLIDYLKGGHTLGEFLRQFPSVSREREIQSLEEAEDSLLARIA